MDAGRNNNGVFIVIEGGEGAGKSTQLKRLKEWLPQAFPGRSSVFTREPGGTPYAEKIRALSLEDADAKQASGRTLIGLVMGARSDHLEKLVEPALAAGKLVISDRYIGSTYAYQIVAQESPSLKPLFSEYARLMRVPDLTIFFDIEPALGLERVSTRKGEVSHFDVRALDFHTRVRAGFREYLETLPAGASCVIDASRSIEDVWNDLERAVSSALSSAMI